jgi:putative MATE family efflux protein
MEAFGGGEDDCIRTGDVKRLYFRLMLPASVSLFVLGLYQFTDGIFVGRLVGPTALGAVGLVYPFTLVSNGIFSLIGIGSASLLSRAIGAGRRRVIEACFGNLLWLNLIFSSLQLWAGLVYAEEIVAFLGGEGRMLEEGVRYLRVIVLGAPLMNFASSANVVIRAEGRMKSAMYIMAGGMLFNILLDPLFIAGFGLGVVGAGLATVTAQSLTALFSLLYFLYGGSIVPVRLAHLRLTRHVGEILRVGVSGMALPVMTIVQIALVLRVTDLYGRPEHLIIVSAMLKILNFIFVPIWGSFQGMQPLVGINYGAGNFERVRRGFAVFALYSSLIAAGLWAMVMLAPAQVLGLFITDPAIARLGIPVIRLYLCNFPLYGYMLTVIALFQALGRSGPAAFLVVSRMSIFFIPAILLLPRLIGLPGVWLATPASDTVVLVIGTIMVSRELLRHRRKELERERRAA